MSRWIIYFPLNYVSLKLFLYFFFLISNIYIYLYGEIYISIRSYFVFQHPLEFVVNAPFVVDQRPAREQSVGTQTGFFAGRRGRKKLVLCPPRYKSSLDAINPVRRANIRAALKFFTATRWRVAKKFLIPPLHANWPASFQFLLLFHTFGFLLTYHCAFVNFSFFSLSLYTREKARATSIKFVNTFYFYPRVSTHSVEARVFFTLPPSKKRKSIRFAHRFHLLPVYSYHFALHF